MENKRLIIPNNLVFDEHDIECIDAIERVYIMFDQLYETFRDDWDDDTMTIPNTMELFKGLENSKFNMFQLSLNGYDMIGEDTHDSIFHTSDGLNSWDYEEQTEYFHPIREDEPEFGYALRLKADNGKTIIEVGDYDGAFIYIEH